jgi:hypothetical protein
VSAPSPAHKLPLEKYPQALLLARHPEWLIGMAVGTVYFMDNGEKNGPADEQQEK